MCLPPWAAVPLGHACCVCFHKCPSGEAHAGMHTLLQQCPCACTCIHTIALREISLHRCLKLVYLAYSSCVTRHLAFHSIPLAIYTVTAFTVPQDPCPSLHPVRYLYYNPDESASLHGPHLSACFSEFIHQHCVLYNILSFAKLKLKCR